ncbi:hypothetical protein BUALT_Bualt13G0115000 [Buddleja alternifolia]|uniref:non-specific serine/threonine protein kinase n=1 Tax=Buddleja alternifolia TaxID=168488 RepID=A0AAV6WXJ9_9LAMI|nr:hypothetical protein BUALT_Bualt13G0115000 [Buddleja alternifolia]
MPKERDKIFLPYILLFLLTTTIIHHISATDADVMAKLAKSISPTPGGWSGSNFCKWQGISCDSSSRVSSINLSSKSLSGMLPSEINQLSGLKSLSLQRNRFSGPLPPLTNLGSLEEVNLDENGFNSIPTGFLSGLTSLQSFSINNNSNLPPWTIPGSLKDSTSLTTFLASKSSIIGEIPDIFGSLPNFQNLRISYNNMTGSLPSSFANSGIQNLWLNNQVMGFSGSIDVLGTMTQLKTVWLHANKFSGPIPNLTACTELNDLLLRDNALTGVIPDSVTKLPKLQNIALQNNKFQGPMPSFSRGVQVNLGSTNSFCLNTPGPCDPQVNALLQVASAMYYPLTLAESWEGNNPCQDWKFITCDRGNVAIINFGKQNLTGLISPSFANLTELKSLFLNDNQLEGTIPDSLTGLKHLQILDLSNNNISGKVPSFPSTVTVRLNGNIFIGKDVPLSPRAQGSSSNNRANRANSPAGRNNQKKSSFPTWAIVLIVLATVLVLAILGFVIYKRYFNKKNNDRYKWFTKQSGSIKSTKKTVSSVGKTNNNNLNSISNDSNSINETPVRSSAEKSDYHVYDGGNVTIPIEVLREATDNFNENNIIGKGGFGVVYRGKLHDGTQIAVKRMESSSIDKGLNEFKAEIEVLTKVRHRHLVALHGFCDNGNERLLVYEYMPQGCLNRRLFHWLESEIPPLTWNQRVIVALDVARGVEYLHGLAQQSFIHRDLKPSNILLGDDMRAKVADFGLVKSAPDGKYSLETRLAGTFGYLAPEYAATGRVTTKVDVFAFGVVLMEIISGRKALDDSLPDDRAQLVSWFRRLLLDREAIRGAVDPVLTTTIDEESLQSIWKVAELAGHCTAREPYQRPDMSHAVNVLSPLVEQWKPAPDEDDSFGVDFHMSLPQVLQRWKATDDTSSTTNSDFYNGNSSNTYSTSSNSTAMRMKPSQFTSSFEDH